MPILEFRADPQNGIKRLLNRLGSLLGLVRNPRDLLDDIGVDMLDLIEQAYEQERSPEGSPWPKSLRAQCEGGKTLTDTGRFRNSWFMRNSGARLEITTDWPYADVHQFGATIRAKNKPYLVFRVCGQWVKKKQVVIPARPILPENGIPDEWQRQVFRRADSSIIRAWGAN